MSDLHGAAVVVTGGASGIGLATVRAFGERGASVILADIDHSGADRARLLREAGLDVRFQQADVTSVEACSEIVAACIGYFGRVDIAVNNVGVVDPAIEDGEILPTQAWDRTIALSLSSTFYCIQAQLGAMLPAGGGSIVNIASVGGLVSLNRKLAYVSAKHGVIGLTKAICDTYGSRNIRCNAVAPGLIETPGLKAAGTKGNATSIDRFASQIPSGRLGTAEDIARAVLWLASSDAEYANGTVLTVDGGYVVR